MRDKQKNNNKQTNKTHTHTHTHTHTQKKKTEQQQKDFNFAHIVCPSQSTQQKDHFGAKFHRALSVDWRSTYHPM